MKGFNLPFKPLQEVTEELAVRCKRCGNIWKEEITHWGIYAGYARDYDCCEKCITEEDKKELGIKGK